MVLTRHTLANTKHDRDQWKDTAAVRLANLKTTTESLNGALAQIDDNNKRIEAANRRFRRLGRKPRPTMPAQMPATRPRRAL
jgi:hypothetical protein